MKVAEIILGVLCLLAVLLKIFLVTGLHASILLALAMMLLSLYYLIFTLPLCTGITLKNIFKKESYEPIGERRSMIVFSSFLSGLSLAITLIGLLFIFQFWPMAFYVLSSGLKIMGVALILSAIRYIRTKSVFYVSVFKRMLVVGIVGLFFLLMPSPSLAWAKILYRNYPEYIEAMEAFMKDPENRQLQENVDNEYEKIWRPDAQEIGKPQK
jgi:hypothetical protein